MKHLIASYSTLNNRQPFAALVNGVDLVIIRYDDHFSVLYGRCLHRGALLSDGFVEGNNLICGLHGWDYRIDSGVSEYNNSEHLHKFPAFLENDSIYVWEKDINEFLTKHPQPFDRTTYLGAYADTHPEPDPWVFQGNSYRNGRNCNFSLLNCTSDLYSTKFRLPQKLLSGQMRKNLWCWKCPCLYLT